MNCYYAHCVALYNTPQEQRDIDALHAIGLRVINPNSPANDAAYASRGMQHFVELVTACDCLAFRGLPDGSIPGGVAKEIDAAIECGKVIFELPSLALRRRLTVDESRAYLKEIGNR